MFGSTSAIVEVWTPEMLPRIARLVSSRRSPVNDIHKIAIAGSPQHCAERIEEYLEAGISHFLLDFQYHGLTSVDYSIRQMDRFVSEVVPLLNGQNLPVNRTHVS